ncbi:MAG: NTP transferase domain-containing protein [Nanoarchaeota archaeon]
MKAAVLVGGEGKRMGGIIKSLLDKNGKTVLQYIIDGLNKYGINDIILITNGKNEFDKFGYKTVQSFAELKKFVKDDFLLLVGDTIVNIDFNDLINFHNKNPKVMTIVTQDYQIPYGIIENGKWIEKPIKEIAIGIFICKPESLNNDFSVFTDSIKKFKTYKFNGNFVHLTKQEDYEKWKK